MISLFRTREKCAIDFAVVSDGSHQKNQPHPKSHHDRNCMVPGPVNKAGGELFHAIACEEFSNLLRSVRASIVRVEVQSSIRAPT
jgi:hypothetical protein